MELAVLRARVAELDATIAGRAAAANDFVLTMLDTLPDPVFVKDEQHRWILVNRAFCSFMGQTREALLGKSDYDFFPEQEAEVFWRLDNLLFETGETNENEESFTDRGGTEHVIATKKALCRDAVGNKVLVGVIRDITARVGAETALRRTHEELERRVRERTADLERVNADLRASEDRYRATFEQAAVGIAHVGIDGRFLRVNARFCEILGYSPPELLGRSYREFTHPDDLPQSEHLLVAAAAGRSPPPNEKRYIRKDGAEVWTHLTTTLAHDANGRPTYLITVIQDISPRNAAERALAASEAQLRQSQKMEAVGRLAGGVAHDFNNLLLVINVNCEIARRSLPEGSSAIAMLDEALNAAKRAAGLTRQLLTFTRQQVTHVRVLDVNEIVLEMASMSRRLIGEDVLLRTVLDPEAWTVRADPDQLTQVLMNLVVNARDAMPDGGVVTIATANATAPPEGGPNGVSPGEYLRVTVTDTGCGMDQRTQGRLFEPFFTTKPAGKGTGLGLSTVYGIVKETGGSIAVQSEVGRGSTFDILLPRTVAPAVAMPAAGGETSVPRGAETVLLVDDEPMVRNVVSELLRRNGYTALVAASPAEAIALAAGRAGPIHVLLTDVVMPGMNGRVLASHVSESHRETAVVYMSGYTPSAILHHGVIDDATAFLQKPFNEQALVRALRDALAKAPGRRIGE